MAALAHSGAQVSLLTATRGELGEVIPAELKQLEQGLPGSVLDGGAGLARVRTEELAQAVVELGITRQVFLGEFPALMPAFAPTSYRDSGMSWGPDGRAQAAATVLPGSFSRTSLQEVAAHTAALIRALRPDVVITYAADGGYGHPDHVYCHQMTIAAIELAAVAGDAQNLAWNVPLTYTILSDRPERAHDPAAAVWWIEGELDAKREAMRAHRTQVVVAEDCFALSDLEFRPLSAKEGFQLFRIARQDVVGSRAASLAASPGEDTVSSEPRQRSISDWMGYGLSALFAGVLVAALGTMLHSRTSMIGQFQLPWGALLALLLLGAVITLIRNWSSSATLGVILGVITYVTCVMFSIPHGQVALIMGDLAGSVWLYGIAVVTVILGAQAALGKVFRARKK